MITNDELFTKYTQRFAERREHILSFPEYLEQCKEKPQTYATVAERMLMAIGDPDIIDTTTDERLNRLFSGRKLRIYPTFSDFYGMEETIENLVAYFKHAAQGLEERKQILYLLGPVGGGKSSLVVKIKELFETIPFYTIKYGNEISPHFEHPFGLFDPKEDGPILEKMFHIPTYELKMIRSPWATKRLEEANGDVTKFQIVKLRPSEIRRIAIAKVEPADENNQDVSALVGKVDIRKLEDFSQHDPDAYSYSGALNITAQGIVDFAEMFKANIKTLNPLLEATQGSSFNGTEGFAAMPFNGVIIAHSNEAEWEAFRNNKKNEAFLDRVCMVKVPYVLRVSEEIKIYQKLLDNSKALKEAPCAPGTLEMLARWSVLTRLVEPENSPIFSKMEVYDGKNLKDKDPSAKTLMEYKDAAGVSEGMTGSSTRFAYKILSRVFNYDGTEVAANPVHLMYILEKQLPHEQMFADKQTAYMAFIKEMLAPKYAEFLQDEIQKAFLESYSEYGQNLFDQYLVYADAWIQNIEYRDHDTGEMYDRNALNDMLEKIEKPAGISNAKDFRHEVVNFCLRAAKNNQGKNPKWTSYEKLRSVIEKKMFANTEELLPVISFSKKAEAKDQEKHDDFVKRMVEKGYTTKQVRLLVEWYMRYRKHN